MPATKYRTLRSHQLSRLNHTSLRILGLLMLRAPYPLTVREISAACGLSENGAKYSITRMQRLGLISKFEGSRTLKAMCDFIPASELGRPVHAEAT